METTIMLLDDDGGEVEYSLPAKNEVCSRCEGHGTHLNPSIGEHAYSAEEFAESFDEEEQEEYFRHGGMYDVSCEVCKGNRVVPIVNEDALNTEQKKIYDRWQEQEEDAAIERRNDAYTYRMESGGYG